MKWRVLLSLIPFAALSGCVLGYGRCMLLSPVRTSLVGTLEFQSYEVGGIVERVALLAPDHSQYVYSPAESHLCQMAGRFQLTGWGDYPADLVEGTRVRIDGSISPATSPHQHTHFVMRVRSIDRLSPPPEPKTAPAPVPKGRASSGRR